MTSPARYYGTPLAAQPQWMDFMANPLFQRRHYEALAAFVQMLGERVYNKAEVAIALANFLEDAHGPSSRQGASLATEKKGFDKDKFLTAALGYNPIIAQYPEKQK